MRKLMLALLDHAFDVMPALLVMALAVGSAHELVVTV